MRALSVPQPWAWAIARGHKAYLNHAANTDYRGPLALYAPFRAETGYVRNQAVSDANANSTDPVPATGGIVAVVTLTDVCTAGIRGVPCDCGPCAFAGCYHWQVAHPRPLRLPVVALGQPGLWELAPAVAAAVARMAGMAPVREVADPGRRGASGPAPRNRAPGGCPR